MYKKINDKKVISYLDDTDFNLFVSKFRGSLIFKGKSSFSYKLFDNILLFLKKKI